MMTPRPALTVQRLRSALRPALSGGPALALLPALILGGFWLGGERMLIMIALGFPVCLAFAGMLWPEGRAADTAATDGRAGFGAALDRAMHDATQSDRKTACFLLELDDLAEVQARFGLATTDRIVSQLGDRLRAVLRERDRVCQLDEGTFGVALNPVRRLDLGSALHLAGRLQAALEEAQAVDSATVHLSASVGLALNVNVTRKSGAALLDAAGLALTEARRHGPSGLRAYSADMQAPATHCDADLVAEASEALENGQIQPWFQPQISTDTGLVTGFEALARWMHPVRGVLPPPEFLPALEQAGRMERLGEIILYGALGALKAWDAEGLDVPQVGVNFSPEELRNPRLTDKIEWDLDRFGLSPGRLSVEILETVVASSPDDTVVRNIGALSKMGCRIDLDDFGTGHASISSIRRFDVQRLKIDRSFVMQVDRDPDQQRLVSAILLMAERLGLDTLAEGVETAGEHTMLSQLGCGHVQGFGIGRPMPFDQTSDWIAAHLARLDGPPRIGRQIG